jgi:Yip1 domain
MAVDASPEPDGLKVALDTIVAPKAAFESIRIAPTWGWAFLLAIVIGTLSTYLITPALVHAYPGTFAQQVATNPQLSSETPEQQQMALAIGEKFVSFLWLGTIIGVPLVVLVSTVIMLIFDKIGHGDGSFGKYWAAACNIAIPGFAVASALSAIIVLVRGADSFTTEQAVQSAIPSLALFAPSSNVKLIAFLATITPFSLWALGLNVVAMRIIGRVPVVPAWLAALVMLAVPAILAAVGAK